MISYTAKSVVSNLHHFADSRKYILSMEALSEERSLEFEITNGSIVLKQKVEDLEVMSHVADIEMMKLPEECKPVSLTEISILGETSKLDLQFEAQLFVKVFKAMRDRVMFTIDSKIGRKECIYLGKKMYFVEEDETNYKLVETNLYKFHRMYGDYSIITFSPVIGRLDPSLLIENNQQVAKDLGKEFSLLKC